MSFPRCSSFLQCLSFLRCSSFPRKRESSSRKAGLFTSACFRLKSLFRFTMSRVRNLSRVAITGSAGFGLVETLVVAGVSLTLGYGIIKTSLVGMQTNAIVHTSLKEQDLIHTVRTTLGNPDQCKYNLKPSALTTAGTPPKTTVSEIKNTGPDKSVTTDDISLIKAGENFKNSPLIHIQQMELSGTTGDRTFILYYKKPQLGSLSSPGTCTDSDPSGCYFIACKVDYCIGSTCSTEKCSPRNCAEGGAVAGGVSPERVTTIIQNKLKQPVYDCPTGQYAKGFNAQGEIECDTLPAVRCPTPNTFLKGFSIDANGNPQPDCACRGGQQLYERWQIEHDWTPLHYYYAYFLVGSSPYELHPLETVYAKTKVCLCTPEQGWKNGNCVTCESGKKWDYHSQQCMTCSLPGSWRVTTSGYGWSKKNTCRCSSDKKKKKVVQCILAYSYVQVGKPCHKGYVARTAKLIKAVYVAYRVSTIQKGNVARPVRAMTTAYVAPTYDFL